MAKVDSQAQLLLDEWGKTPNPPLGELTAEDVRNDDASLQELSGVSEHVFSVEDIAIPASDTSLQARIYRPSAGPLPTLVYFHGGGFVVGPESYDIPLRSLTNKAGCVVVRVTCRLAPEHLYPAAVKDAYAATLWLNDNASRLNIDSRIAIAGDSSGGNLAAVVSRKLKEADAFKPAFQILIYPMLDATASTASYQTFATGFGFSREKSLWYFDQYLLRDADRHAADISPYWQTDYRNLPPTFVATAGCDPLRDEAEAYAERLELAGVPAKLKRYEGMIHGFFQMAGALDQGRELHDDISIYVRKAFGL